MEKALIFKKKKKMRRKMGIFSCIFKDLLSTLKYNVEHTLAVLLKIKMTKTTMSYIKLTMSKALL